MNRGLFWRRSLRRRREGRRSGRSLEGLLIRFGSFFVDGGPIRFCFVVVGELLPLLPEEDFPPRGGVDDGCSSSFPQSDHLQILVNRVELGRSEGTGGRKGRSGEGGENVGEDGDLGGESLSFLVIRLTGVGEVQREGSDGGEEQERVHGRARQVDRSGGAHSSWELRWAAMVLVGDKEGKLRTATLSFASFAGNSLRGTMATAAGAEWLFNDQFTVTEVDPGGKKFDRVSRIVAKSSNHDMHLTLDINVDLLPLTQGEAFSLALSSSLLPEGAKATDAGGWRAGIDGGLADDWEYVMYGKVYKFDQDTKDSVTAYASYGGLLMALSGDYRHISGVTVGEYVYLLIRH